MKHPARIVRWESTVDASTCGIELVGLGRTNGRAKAELDDAVGILRRMSPRFIIVSGLSSARDLENAIARISEVRAHARVCFALGHETLAAVNPALLRNLDFGVLLDGVDADTPWGAMIAEGVEAIRFNEAFAERASTDLRLSCVLDSILGLAHDLGLATLNSGPFLEQRPTRKFQFDYISQLS